MKRLRPVNSCYPCRNRRLKCDKEHPSCGRCRTTGQQCAYDHSAIVTTPLPDSEPIRSASVATTSAPSASSATREPSSAQAVGERGRFSVSYGGRTSYSGATFWGNAIPADVADIDDWAEGQTIPPAPVNSFSTQRIEEHATPYSGPFRLPPNSDLAVPASVSRSCRMCGREYRLSCIQSMLPDRATCEKLCLVFFGKVFSLIPILHLPSFREDFDDIWQHLDQSRSCQAQHFAPIVKRKPGLLCLVFSIMFSTLYSTPEATLKTVLEKPAPEVTAKSCYLALTIVARLTGFPRRPTPYTLAAYIYTQSQFAREEDFRDAPEFVGMSFRLAIGMGLHRQMRDVTLETGELETRRRLWWYILHLDVMVSSSSGLSPLFIDDKMSNARMIHVYDEFFDRNRGSVRRVSDIRYIVAAKRYETSKEVRNILRLHFEDAFDNRRMLVSVENRLAALSDNIGRTCDSILQMCSSCSLPSSNYRDLSGHGFDSGFSRIWSVDPAQACDAEAVNFGFWSVLLLHMMVHKAYCTLYHPLFSQNSVDEADQLVSASAVKHSQAFLHIFVHLCEQPGSEPFHWMYPGTYQPLQAVSLLVADLLQRPHSDSVETSRGIIDRVFEMYSIDHGIVNHNNPVKRDLSSSGKAAWLMLARARRQALEQIGEDPHILLSSSDEDTSKCLCGQDLGAPSLQRRVIVGGRDVTDESQPSLVHDIDAEEQQDVVGQEFEDPFMGSADFDWQGFDAVAGGASGFMS